jgi:hypothetical protein
VTQGEEDRREDMIQVSGGCDQTSAFTELPKVALGEGKSSAPSLPPTQETLPFSL